MNPRRPAKSKTKNVAAPAPPPVYPFTAIVGQEDLKLALLLNAIEPAIGGVLIMGERGTGKSTAVRALAALLPPLTCVRGCAYGCDPEGVENLCEECRARLANGEELKRERASVPLVDLPLGATEDRVCGTINLERALAEGVKTFEAGLLARAHRGFLYIDEVNLLEDHLVDLLLDCAATGQNRVEREGISTVHPARFVLVGSGNPEEGELRPQLLDRFGLYTEVRAVAELEQRVQIVERSEAFSRDPRAFLAETEAAQTSLRRRLARARRLVSQVEVPRPLVRHIAELCMRLQVDGHRGELTIARAARTLAAYEGRREATAADVARVAALALTHRLRRDPLEQTDGGSRIRHALEQLHDDDAGTPNGTRGNGDGQSGRDKSSHFDKTGHAGDDSAEESFRFKKNQPRDAGDENGAQSKRGEHNKRHARPQENGKHENGATLEEENLPPADARLPEGLLDKSSLKEPMRGRTSSTASAARRSAGTRSSRTESGGRYALAVAARPSVPRVALDATLRAAAPMQLQRRASALERAALDTASRVALDTSARVRHDAPASAASALSASATVAASASRTHAPRALHVAADDLRYKHFRRKTGTLFIVAIDTSGSMAANRISQAKGALTHLLRRSYVNRDRLALVSFREREAALLLAPSRSPARAKRILDALPVGGATPLNAALLRSLEVAKRASRQGAEQQRIVLIIFTDGRANVALQNGDTQDRDARRRSIASELERLGTALGRAGVSTVVVDTQNRFTSGGEARTVALALGGRCVQLPLRGGEQVVRQALSNL